MRFSIDKLHDGNFTEWRENIAALLVCEGVSAAIEPSFSRAADAAAAVLDVKAKAVITLFVEPQFLPQLAKAASAKDALDSLEKLLVSKGEARKQRLWQQMMELTKKPDENMTKFGSRSLAIWNEMEAAKVGGVTEQDISRRMLQYFLWYTENEVSIVAKSGVTYSGAWLPD